MTFRIQRATSGGQRVVIVSGEIAAGHESDLRTALDTDIGPGVRLDLGGLTVVDLPGVLLLAAYEARGASLGNCPGYVRRWIDRERENQMVTVQGATREHTFTGERGLTLCYRAWRPAGTPRAVVVIVPGFNSHSGYYEWTAARLTSADIAVYAVDLRGRGQSDGDRFYVASFAEYVSDVAGMVDVARSVEPGLPTFLLGHSAGAVLACLYAVQHQASLAGLVCESVAFQTPAPEFALAALKGLSHVFPHAPCASFEE